MPSPADMSEPLDGPPASARRRGQSRVWWFTEGALLAVILISVTFARREDEMVIAVARADTRPIAAAAGAPPSAEDHAVEIMHSVHDVLWSRLQGLDGTGVGRGWWFRSTYSHLMAPTGHCGSFTHVLARALQLEGFEVRIGQMLVGDVWGGHIIVLVMLDGRLVPLDPYFDLAFRGPDGHLLSLSEVQRDWPQVRAQCPPNYDPDYDYRDIRYTNWRGVPMDLLGSFFGEVSVRTKFLNLYWASTALAGVALGVVVAVHGMRERRGYKAART